MKRFTLLILISLLSSVSLVFSTVAQAQDGASLYVAKGCDLCHGADGNTPIMSLYPKIAGQNAVYTLNQLKDFKAGLRKNAMGELMRGMVATLTDEELQQLADFLSGEPSNKGTLVASSAASAPAQAESKDIKESSDTSKENENSKGSTEEASIYVAKGCVACHGADGNTPLLPTYPKIAGQNAVYTLNQLNDFKAGTRKNALAALMTGIVAPLTDDELQQLADYLSGDQPSAQAKEPIANKQPASSENTVVDSTAQVAKTDDTSIYAVKGCAACHGADGNTPLAANYPKVAGQNASYIINQLNAFKKSTRKNGLASLMTGIVAALSDDDIQKLAAHLSQNPVDKDISIAWPSCKAWCVGGMTGMEGQSNKKEWEPCKEWCEQGMPKILVKTETTHDPFADRDTLYYKKACIACHGDKGDVPVMDVYPKIGGQSEVYLLAQMKDIKTGLRNNSHSIAMTNMMSFISDNEMASIAKWLSEQAH